MAFMVIASITVPILEGQAVERRERNAEAGRAFASNLRSAALWTKRVWQATTGLLTATEVTALRNAVANRAHVAVTVNGTAVTAEVVVGDAAYVNTSTADGTGLLRTLALVVSEV